MESLNTTKVPLSSLIDKTPVTVRFEDGREFSLLDLYRMNSAISVVTDGRGMAWDEKHLVEVLPAKETTTPLTDAEQWETDEGSEVVYASFALKLELERAALLSLIERLAEADMQFFSTADLRADARALLAQLKTPPLGSSPTVSPSTQEAVEHFTT